MAKEARERGQWGGMAWLRKYWLKIFLLTLSSVLAAGVFVSSVLAGDEKFKDRDSALWMGAAAALVVVLVTASETALNEREKTKAREEARRTAGQLRLWYNDVLADLSEPLGKLAHEYAQAYAATTATPPAALTAAQSGESTKILRAVLVGAATLTAPLDPAGLPTARSAFYRLTDPTRHEFTLEDWAGRPYSPRGKIDGSAGSHFLHDVLEGRAPYHAGADTGLVSKVDQSGARYRSVIAVPVVAGSREFGVLAVDAPGDTDLTTPHVRSLQSLAEFLGATLALA
ncbi:GAF domain-containing protein [Streptomyces sp. NA04227]|uniref:GAF domain-containing protein n=1 Tax=Streptomyces sp. NA04227 TaxID=2742136 RepID=UPI001590A7AF|nr:GAF domain-containing protein [Streptomyces sp. NA04227]QKW08557.1 GAF domain-containing protein [Streptomyces sp. NA04227]